MAARSLPALGPRGEGWFAAQLPLLGAVALGAWVGPAWTGPVRVAGAGVGLALGASGGLLALRGVLDLGSSLTVFPRPRARARLVDTGVYGRVRHPIYGGLVLGAVGWGLLTASPVSLAFALLLGAFFTLKSRREEVWLAEAYPGYGAYRRRTRRFVPWLW